MEEAGQQGQHRVSLVSTSTSTSAVAVGRHFIPDNLTEQPLLPKAERIGYTSSRDTAMVGPPIIVTDQPETLVSNGALATALSPNAYTPEQSFYYGGYDNSSGTWGEYSNYINANNLQIVPPALYNDNPSLFFPSGYGFDSQVAFGQFSPLANPMSPVMVDGQLYSPHQIPVSPNYYPQSMSPGIPHVTFSHSMSQAEMMTPVSSGQDGLNDSMLFGPGSGYYMHYGSFAGGNPSGNSSLGFYGSGEILSNQSNPSDTGNILSPLTPGAVYTQPFGLLGSYEHNLGQVGLQASQQQTQFTRRYPNSGSFRSPNYGNWDTYRFNRLTHDKSGRRERDRDSVSISTDSHGLSNDRNRGPRGSKPKGKNNNTEGTSSPGTGKAAGASSTSRVNNLDLYNRPDFVTDYNKAKFFVIKSFSEDNVHKSIKYSIWASTPLGNRKLDAAYHEAKETKDKYPVFLFFSVNASGQFCGVAEMIGSVDFENDADYWQQDRWSGRFPVKWHIIKDVPNGLFRHILLEKNDNKPVTHSRDSQEVKLEQGLEMLKIFKEHDTDTSILDDFIFYDERERKSLQEKKSRQQSLGKTQLSDASIDQLSENLADTLKLKVGEGKTP